MRTAATFGGLGGLLIILAGCAPTADGGPGAQASGPRECFFVNRVTGFTDGGDERSINVSVSRREAYQLTAVSYCRDINWSNQVALEPGSGRISLCTGDLADVVMRPAGGPVERCQMRVVRKLSPEEAAQS